MASRWRGAKDPRKCIVPWHRKYSSSDENGEKREALQYGKLNRHLLLNVRNFLITTMRTIVIIMNGYSLLVCGREGVINVTSFELSRQKGLINAHLRPLRE